MVIFHSYVSLPEGNHDAFPIQKWDFPVTLLKNHHVGNRHLLHAKRNDQSRHHPGD